MFLRLDVPDYRGGGANTEPQPLKGEKKALMGALFNPLARVRQFDHQALTIKVDGQPSKLCPSTLETRTGRIIKPVCSQKSHVASPFQAFAHGITVCLETARVTRAN